MFKLFKPHDKYEIRHKILELLYQKIQNEPHFNINLRKTRTEMSEISLVLNQPISEIHKYHLALHANNHILCKVIMGKHILFLNEEGVNAYADEYWLKEGEKEVNERFYDKTKWTIPVISLIVTIASILYSSIKVQGMQEKVSKLKTEIEILKYQRK